MRAQTKHVSQILQSGVGGWWCRSRDCGRHLRLALLPTENELVVARQVWQVERVGDREATIGISRDLRHRLAEPGIEKDLNNLARDEVCTREPDAGVRRALEGT